VNNIHVNLQNLTKVSLDYGKVTLTHYFSQTTHKAFCVTISFKYFLTHIILSSWHCNSFAVLVSLKTNLFLKRVNIYDQNLLGTENT